MGSSDNDWDGVIDEFGDKIRALAGAEFHDQFVQEFSTTTKIESTAMKVTLMEAGSLYFTFGLLTRCGIPAIELEGTLEDWEKIARLASTVANYGLGWWTPYLSIVTEQLLEMARGRADLSFWKDFYKANEASGGPYVNGHILKLFPYVINHSKALCKNEFFDCDGNKGSFDGCPTRSFPGGYSIAPMRWKYFGKLVGMKLISGFAGFSQDDRSVLRPEIGWVIAEAPSMLDEDASLPANERGAAKSIGGAI